MTSTMPVSTWSGVDQDGNLELRNVRDRKATQIKRYEKIKSYMKKHLRQFNTDLYAS